jgi:hypothetical protein
MSLTTPCDFAKARYLDMKVLKLRWNYLILCLGIVVVLFAIVSIFLFVVSFPVIAAVSGVGTLLTGGAATWLGTQLSNVTAEERKAFEELVAARQLDRTCKPLRQGRSRPWLGPRPSRTSNGSATSKTQWQERHSVTRRCAST